MIPCDASLFRAMMNMTRSKIRAISEIEVAIEAKVPIKLETMYSRICPRTPVPFADR